MEEKQKVELTLPNPLNIAVQVPGYRAKTARVRMRWPSNRALSALLMNGSRAFTYRMAVAPSRSV